LRHHREVFVVDVVDATLANRGVFPQRNAHGAEVALMQYKRANGIPSTSSSE